MAYTRAAAKLIIDNPNADGQVITWGIGRDWEAAEEKAMFRGLSAVSYTHLDVYKRQLLGPVRGGETR